MGNRARSSWLWQSLTYRLRLLKKGLIWCIGFGVEVNIWDDPWLPNSPDFKVQSPCPPDCEYRKVKDLILENPHCWNLEILRTLFNQAEINDIMAIPLSLQENEDILIWPKVQIIDTGRYFFRFYFFLKPVQRDRFKA
uniref:Uncharacterized protein n=1 Tax=Nelumbo nucifera TaxID=4432 RepID=A0A822ZNW1_NELNU|nr:TPA_asm: hypothetical protein HUJ06_003451 [Nelumbo nucifera]